MPPGPRRKKLAKDKAESGTAWHRRWSFHSCVTALTTRFACPMRLGMGWQPPSAGLVGLGAPGMSQGRPCRDRPVEGRPYT